MTEILLLICVILFITILNRISRQNRQFNEKLNDLENLLRDRHVEKPVSFHQRTPVLEKPEPREEPVFGSDHFEPLKNESIFEEPEIETPVFHSQTADESYVPQVPGDSWWEKFKIRNPDLERFVGENLISKIGITILVLGIAFFVKYAIDKNWIGETARVGIGILSGALVNVVAHRLRLRFKAFSSVLVAGAIAIYYFTIAIAFQEYHLFSQATAFVLMIVITAFSLLVSVTYNREELALLSLIGGFATPLMVSTGMGNYIILFSYLLILDIGILVLAYLRKWNIVNLCTFAFTILFYVTWFFNRVYNFEGAPYAGAFLFASLFYMVFTAMILIHDLKEKTASGNLELTLFIGNTGIYYAIGMYLVHAKYTVYEGLFTAGLAVLNMSIGWIFYKYFKADKKLIYLLVGLALTFATLAAPVQLDGNHITLFWAAESVLLLWLSLKSELRNFLYSSVVVSALMVCSLLIDWFQYYTGIVQADMPMVFNQLFMTGLFCCLCIFAKNKLLKKQPGTLNWLSITIDPEVHRTWLRTIGIILLYFVCQIELNYQLRKAIPDTISVNIMLGAYHMVYCALLMLYLYYHRSGKLLMAAYLVALINTVVYAVILCSIHMMEIDHDISMLYRQTIGFKVHFVSLACMCTMIYYIYRIMLVHREKLAVNTGFISWLLAVVIVYVGSIELMLNFCALKLDEILTLSDTLAISEYYAYLKTQMVKIGFPILWSLLSILFLVYGIRKQNKSMRVCSLVLQAVTILKLFAYDMNNVSEAGKITAFIILGVILLIMSFMYQKIKAIIFSDEVPEKA